MPSGTRRLLLAGGSVLALAGCADGTATAPSPPDTSAGTSSAGDAAAEVIATSGPGADVRIATGTSAVGTTADEVLATGAAPSSSGVDAVTTTTAAPTPSGPCASVVALADAVALAEGIDLALPWPELRTSIAESSDAAAQSYLAVVPVAPDDIDDDLQVLAGYNTALAELARGADSLTAFQAAVEPPDEALLAATAEVDEYMRDTCSIGLTAD